MHRLGIGGNVRSQAAYFGTFYKESLEAYASGPRAPGDAPVYLGISRERASAIQAEGRGTASVTKPRWIPAHLRTGSEEQAACRRFWQDVGGVVYVTSNTKQTAATPGLSDELIVLPGMRLLVAWEAKAGDEYYKPTDPRRLTDEQATFIAHMQRGLTTAGGFGDAEAARHWLLARQGAR